MSGQSQAWLDEDYRKRLVFTYQVASLSLVAIGLFWLSWFLIEGKWDMVLLDLAYIGIGLLVWYRIRRGNFYRAAMLCQALVFAILVWICLVYDIPDAAAPRVTHVYFLALGFLSYVTFRRISLPTTYVIVLVYLGAFVLFGSTSFGLPSAQPLPESVRVPGAWIHSIVATTLMCACVYIMNSDFAARSRFGRQITAALTANQFELHFQPQVDSDGKIEAAEALIRWNHPKRGQLSPGEFLPSAEQLGLMKPIGNWVLNSACRKLAEWQTEPDKAGLRLAINVSPQQFHDEDFVAEVKLAVALYGVNPARLELELTESIVVEDVEDVIGKMRKLVEFGVSLSLDDFGTGYSSLKYLKRMPFTQLKIDQSFVRDMLEETRNAAIVRGIIRLGRELDLSVIAEGVETAEQHRFLREHDCERFQGYLFGRPVPAVEFAALVRGASAA